MWFALGVLLNFVDGCHFEYCSNNFTTLHLLHDFKMGPINYNVTMQNTWKACQDETPQLIGPIRKLPRKRILPQNGTTLLSNTMYLSCNWLLTWLTEKLTHLSPVQYWFILTHAKVFIHSKVARCQTWLKGW